MLDVVFLVYPLIISLSVQCNTIGTKLFSKAICNLDKMSSALLDQITGISQPPFFIHTSHLDLMSIILSIQSSLDVIHFLASGLQGPNTSLSKSLILTEKAKHRSAEQTVDIPWSWQSARKPNACLFRQLIVSMLTWAALGEEAWRRLNSIPKPSSYYIYIYTPHTHTHTHTHTHNYIT